MKKTTRIISKAGVLLITAVMLLSALPVVMANTQTTTGISAGEAPPIQVASNVYPFGRSREPYLTGDKFLYNQDGTLGEADLGQVDWIQYHSGYTDNSLGLTAAGKITMAITLTDVELAGFRGDDIVQIEASIGSDAHGFYTTPFDLWIEPGLPAAGDVYTGGVNIVYSGAGSGVDWDIFNIPAYTIPATGDVTVGLNFNQATGQYPCGIDESLTQPAPRANHVTYEGLGSWSDLNTIGFPGVWGISVGVEEGEDIPDDCLPDQCDFAILRINQAAMYEGKINQLPQIINITIGNLGEIGIAEVKLLADVYKKVCGPTTLLYDDCLGDYCLQTWDEGPLVGFSDKNWVEFLDDPVFEGDVWTIVDDGDDDTWVMQGGADNNWYQDGRAWRNTPGDARSYGGDEDTYLGLSPTGVGPDTLIWNPIGPGNVLSGAAGATFSFWHWMEGEYTLDSGGNAIPIDYGVISYSLDGGLTWADVPISDFVAFDNDWEQVTIQFINTAIDDGKADWQHTFEEVCGGLEAIPGAIRIYEDFPDTAELAVAFRFYKDPCLQFEGWYIDCLELSRTETYNLELVHQTHEIIQLPPCEPEVSPWQFYEFPLGYDPEPDTWYEIHICGQVFEPNGCEINVDNNCIYTQFLVTDIHDVLCKDMKLITPQETTPGESVSVNMTVKNIGTFVETVPVELRVAKAVVDTRIDEEFETDPSGRWSFYYFIGYQPKNLFRWTKNDASIDNIYDSDAAQARSLLPGSESLICANQGAMPYLEDNIGNLFTDGEIYDLKDVESAELTFYTKWSLGIGWDTYWDEPFPGTETARAAVWVNPKEGPDSAFWWVLDFGAWVHGGTYHNDWHKVNIDMKDVAEQFAYGDGIVPPIEFGWGVLTDGFDQTNKGNPLPWSGFMIDRIKFDLVSKAGQGTVVDTATVPNLFPGEEKTVTLTWDEAGFCSHVLTGATMLATDVNPENDECEVLVKVFDRKDLDEEFGFVDLTTEQDCLWTICDNRPGCGGGHRYAWAGIEEAQWGHYVTDMNDDMVSPMIDLRAYDEFGVSMNITHWWKFFGYWEGQWTGSEYEDVWKWDSGDLGQVFVRSSPAENWELLKTVTASSNPDFDPEIMNLGNFVEDSFWITPEMCTQFFQIKFKMISGPDWDPTGLPREVDEYGNRVHYNPRDPISEGWFIERVELVEITGIDPAYVPPDGTFGGDESYIIDAGAASFNWFDVATPGVINYIGPYPFTPFPQGACFDANGVLWFTDTDGNIYTIDESTGTFTSVGASGAAGGLTSIAYDDTTGVLYGASSTSLYTIDTSSGSASLVGPITGITSLWISMDFDSAGNLYGYDLGGVGASGLYSVDKNTGAATLVGYTGLNLNYGQDMSYDKDNDIMYAAVFNAGTFLPELHTVDLNTGAFTLVGPLNGNQFTSFAITYSAVPDYNFTYGDIVWLDDFHRQSIAPWTCESGKCGGFWRQSSNVDDLINADDFLGTEFHVIRDYDKFCPINDVLWTSIDLTSCKDSCEDPESTYVWVKLDGYMDFAFSQETAYIEISANWEPGTPMEDATWITFWERRPGDISNTGGWVLLSDLVDDDDDRFVLNQFIGQVIYIRFRLRTPGLGAAVGDGWAVDNLHIYYKCEEGPGFVDDKAPVTSIFIDSEGKVTLVAVDYPLNKNSGVKATYYQLNGGETQTYSMPFQLPEGTTTITYWSEDNWDPANVETKKTATFTLDTTPPVVDQFVSPEEGMIYLFGSPLMSRILGTTTICIGRVPVEVDATDFDGSGIRQVNFMFDNDDTGFATSPPYTYTYRGMHFGPLTITAVAIDNAGLMSQPKSTTVNVYSLGLL